jgi:hypothetical protein
LLALFTTECQALGHVSRPLAHGPQTADALAMEQKGLRTGHFVALIGALVVFGSLWRPWYAIEIPQQLRDAFGSSGALGRDPGLLGAVARNLAAALPSSISLSGWRALESADMAMAAGALVVIALVLAAAGTFGGIVRVDPRRIGSLIAAVGGAGVAVVLAHVINKPGPSQASAYIHLASGLWIALIGCAAVVTGGLMAAAPAPGARPASAVAPSAFPRLDPELPPVFTHGPGAASVPPPGAAS